VKELPRLNKLIIEGNDEIKEKDIVLAAGKVRGDVISQYDLYLMKKSIKNLYAKEGLAFAEIETKLEKSDTSDRFYDLYIVIDEGQV
jgi:outer membrane protein assembly factor BamA